MPKVREVFRNRLLWRGVMIVALFVALQALLLEQRAKLLEQEADFGHAILDNAWSISELLIETKNLAGERTWNFKGRPEDMYQTEHNELWASIREGNPINDAERGCNSNLMAIMGRMAAYTGQVVTWDQAMNSEENLTPDRYGIDVAPPPPTVAIPGQTKFV